MASQNNEYSIPPFSGTPPPRVGWWSRPIVSLPTTYDREATCFETTVSVTPVFAAIFTIVAVMRILYQVVDSAQCDAKFTIQAIAVSPSSATWHVDFLVKNPSSRYSIYYEKDETAVSLGALSAAVLTTYHEPKSPSDTAFSVDFVAQGNPNDVVLEKLYIKLKAKYLSYRDGYNNAGHVELFANSVSVSNANANANVSAADWTIGFVAMSPVTGCKLSLHTLKSRLVRRGEVISNSSSPSSDFSVAGDKTEAIFKKVVTPGVIGGDVIWDSQVEIMFAINTNVRYLNGFLLAACSNIPVKFTTDQAAGEVVGSLLGNMRRCDYIYQQSFAYLR
ncbi:uncharacterized protein LOC17883999 [Capsella rubella]|uniref:uncharacterized protein LOC17883999 n=1 Tax=Capsella rubella TaxID=81985 RepID=UPI000CD532A2|nr:uncharacterized protein LOC17883999 [Capsella rubella]